MQGPALCSLPLPYETRDDDCTLRCPGHRCAARRVSPSTDGDRARRRRRIVRRGRQGVSRFRCRYRGERARLRRRGTRARDARGDRVRHRARFESLSHGSGRTARREAGRAHLRRPRVLLQFRRGSERGRVQDRAALGPRHRRRGEARNSFPARRVSWAPVRDTRGDGPSGVSRALPPARGRNLDRRARHGGARRGPQSANGRRGDRGAGAGRGRRAGARARVPAGAA